MAIGFQVKADFKELRKQFKQVSKEDLKKTAAFTLNRIAFTAKESALNTVVRRTKQIMPQRKIGELKRKFHKSFAKANRLVATLSVSGRRLTLIKTAARIIDKKRQKQGVFYSLDGQRRNVKNAFIAKSSINKQNQVFVRTGAHRDSKLRALKALSLPYMLRDKKILEQIDKNKSLIFNVEFKKNLERKLRRRGLK